MLKNKKTVYFCQECGYESAKWMGQCPGCKSWNTFVEETVSTKKPSSSGAMKSSEKRQEPVILKDISLSEDERQTTQIGELDRVLGGGIVPGSLVLVGGDPGIGKSTLLMQLCAHLGVSVMYVSGEESRGQLKMRADRLGAGGSDTLVLCETDMESVLSEYDRVSPKIMIVDSVQTMYSSSATGAPGSVGQVRECTSELIARAKQDNCAVIIVGHVNKEGGIAGPKVLEHMVDAVLYFEGDRSHTYRIVRAVKNRFGSTNEIGVFDMTEDGLREVPNPSELFLASRPNGVSGSCATCVIEGNRPIIAEVQALVVPTAFPSPSK